VFFIFAQDLKRFDRENDFAILLSGLSFIKEFDSARVPKRFSNALELTPLRFDRQTRA
jgi:hypothetical protein